MRGTVEVNQFLIERDVPHEFFRLEHPLRFLYEVPGALGFEPAELVRVRAYEARGRPVCVLIGSDLEPAKDLVAEAAHVPKVRKLGPAAVSRLTGFPAEWAPPVAHERPSTMLLDKHLLALEVVYAPAGEPGVILKIRPEDLLRATGAIPVLLGEPDALRR